MRILGFIFRRQCPELSAPTEKSALDRLWQLRGSKKMETRRFEPRPDDLKAPQILES
jgi:hypothetical protein